jgi:exodeoxyribonuclease V beta subunit
MTQPFDLENIPSHSFVLEASAGTGKTHSLVQIYLSWTLERGLDPLKLPVMTFTEDAAAEMRSRIGLELRKVLEASEIEPDGTSSQKRLRALGVLEDLPRAPIGTIHSFCFALLGRFPLEFGVNIPLEMAPKNHREKLFQEYLWAHPVPWAVAQHHDWKRDRKNLEDFLFGLYQKGWGRRHAGEVFPTQEFLQAIPADLLGRPLRDKAFWQELGEDSQGLGVYSPRSYSGKKAAEDEEKGRMHLLLLRECRDYLLGFDDYYAQKGQRDGQVDFDDMIDLVYQGVLGDQSEVLLRFKEHYQGIIVDEFQDTNLPQWTIIQRGFLRQGLPVVIIGDPKQSIYLFRGGDPRVYFHAKSEIIQAHQGEGATSYVLNQNFRSSEALIQGMNQIFAPVFDGEYLAFSPSRPPSEEIGMVPPVWEDPREPAMEAPLLGGLTEPEEYQKGSWARAVVAHIRALMDRRPSFIPRHKKGEAAEARPLRYGDIAILVQKHKHGNKLFELCQAAGIPVRKTKGVNLFQTNEMSFVQNFLRLLTHPLDEGLLGALLIQGPLGLSWSDYQGLRESESLGACRMIIAEAQQRWSSEGLLMFWDVLEALDQELGRELGRLEKDPATLEERLIVRMGGERELMNYRQILGLFTGKKSWRNPQEALDFLQEERLNRKEEEYPLHLERPGDTVQILTLHGSKGLEFPVVYLVPDYWRFMPDEFQYYHGTFGYGKDFYKKTERSVVEHKGILGGEDQRLYYVGMTRAMVKLIIPLTGKERWGTFLDKAFGPGEQGLRKAQEAGFSLGVLGGTELETQGASGPTVPPPLKNAPWGEEDFLRVEEINLLTKRPGFTSYSGLVRKLQPHLSEEPLVPGAEELEGGETGIRAEDQEPILPRGPKFGDFFHGLMEELDFGLWQEGYSAERENHWVETLEKVESRLWPRQGIGSDQNGLMTLEARQEVRKIVDRVLRTVLPEVGPNFTLADLSPEQCRAELPFYIRTQAQEAIPLIEEPLGLEEGFLKGFIDYVFEYRGKIYFIDWKTNDLGPGPYNQDLMDQEMRSHRYDLQGKIYMVALSHWLGASSPKRTLGGGFYIFLRGAEGPKGVESQDHRRHGVVYLPYDEETYRHWSQELIGDSVPEGSH